MFIAASRARSLGRRRRGAARASPRRKSLPGGADVVAGVELVAKGDGIALAGHILLDHDASAPSGSGAPVKMRTAWPGPMRPA